ncbi:MAG: M3 family metallopeptidase [Myxococcales bacterium]|nr:M3 family metallopeptidase [Myxococcales bacterium]
MTTSNNPLLESWSAPYGIAPFALVRPEHFEPALEATMAEHRRELDAIANSTATPDFDNTIAALDRSGRALARVESLLNNLTSAHTSPALQEVDRRVQPKLAAHHHAARTDAALFARIDAVYAKRESLGLDPESLRLLERLHLDFVRTGARLSPEARARLAEIAEQKATLCTQFEQNVLADEAAYALVLSTEDDLAGLPAFLRDAAKTAARERGIEDKWAITLSRSLIVPFLTYSERRDLRETAFRAWISRGENDGPTDNRPLAQKILALRAEQAKLHGYEHFSQYALVDRMAKEPSRALELLRKVWGPARSRALSERDALVREARALGYTHEIEPWDWRFFAEKVRKRRYELDESELKAYFSLDRMIDAMFDCANKLFGLRFERREDIQAYHPDVRVYEVFARDGSAVGLFLSDNFARPSKMGGAWMSEHRLQSRNGGETLPIIANHNNFAKGSPTLLSLDDVRTLFHEFGHGLHGLLSNVRFRRLSGTNVLKDFVELPSQLFEHWIEQPAVLRQHARHHATGEPIPEALVARARDARKFNQGFDTVEYTACALLDLALHSRVDAAGVNITEFEREELARIEMPAGMVLRHRLPHFAHLFASDGYAAGYYVYLWAEVLDADGFDAFIEAGDIFDPKVADRLLRYVYSAGNTIEPGAAYRAFRGRDPEVAPLLAKRGLVEDSA